MNMLVDDASEEEQRARHDAAGNVKQWLR